MFAHSRCGKAYPAVFSLLPNKKSKTYEKLWEIIKETINLDMPDKEPLHMLLDFELASINTFQNSFPNTAVSGCHFHFRYLYIYIVQVIKQKNCSFYILMIYILACIVNNQFTLDRIRGSKLASKDVLHSSISPKAFKILCP